jgi:hypothetical protein
METPYFLRVENSDGTRARIRLNGAVIVAPADFTAEQQVIERPVAVEPHNVLSVRTLGDPKGTLTVSVLGLDEDSPGIETIVTPAPNAAGWHDRDVTVRFVCADEISGIARCSPPVVFRKDGSDQSAVGVAIDLAGNRSTATARVHLDKTPPGLSAQAQGPPDDDGNVTIVGTADEPTSGIDALTCEGLPAELSGNSFSCSVKLAAGGNEVVIAAMDRAGNRASTSLLDLSFVPTSDDAPGPVITSPANFAVLGPETAPDGRVTVAGIVPFAGDATAPTVAVDGVVAEVSASTTPPGWGFVATDVPLREGHNILTATVSGSPQRTSSVFVTLDTTAPDLQIETPAHEARVAEPLSTVTGRVYDRVAALEGRRDPRVTVNGVEALVSNGTFVAFDVQLRRGPNTLTATARDDVGNETTRSIFVTLDEPVVQKVRVRSGDRQSAVVDDELAEPLVAALTDSLGNPVAGRLVKFEVTRGDGRLDDGSTEDRTLLVPTDGDGLAAVSFTLGTRSGAGNHRVRATAVGFAGEAGFVASAAPGPAAALKLVGGANQTGATGQRLPEPLVAFVHDARGNPVPGEPVEFRVRLGDGKIDGQPAVVTDRAGVAVALLTLGSDVGTNAYLATASLPAPTGGAPVDVVEPGGPPSLSARQPRQVTRSEAGPDEADGQDRDTPSPLPVAFFAAGSKAENAETSVHGIVLDQTGGPLSGATVQIHHPTLETPLSGSTDSSGEFAVTDVPIGRVTVEIDGSTLPSGSWVPLRYELTTVPGNENAVDRPIHLVEIDDDSAQPLGVGGETRLTMTGVPGMELIVPPGAVSCPDADDPEACVGTLTQVHADTLPATPPGGVSPRLAWTVQPDDLEFEPTAVIETPNVDDFRPGQVIDLFALDVDRGEFVRVGTGTVTEDGSVVRAELGASGTAPGLAFTATPPPAQTCVLNCDDGNQCTDDFAVEPCRCESILKPPSTPGGTVSCDDGKYCTENDACTDGVCEGSPVGTVVEPSSPIEIELEFDRRITDAADALSYGPCEVTPFEKISFSAVNDVIHKCCESDSQIAGERILQTGRERGGKVSVSLLTVECPVPGLSIKIKKPKITVGLVVGLILDGALQISGEFVECSGAACDLSVELSLGLTLYGKVTIETPIDFLISFSAGVSAGGRLIWTGTCGSDCASGLSSVDLNSCDGSVQACIGPIKLWASAKLFAFIKVSYSFNIPGTTKCWP